MYSTYSRYIKIVPGKHGKKDFELVFEVIALV